MTREDPPPAPGWAAALGFTAESYAAASSWADGQIATAPALSPRQRDRLRAIFAATPPQT